MLKVKYTKGNVEKTDVVFDDQGRIGVNVEPTAQLDINGTLRVRDLKSENLMQALRAKQEIQHPRGLVSDSEGNIFNLPYWLPKGEEHFFIPISRSGWWSLKGNGTKSFEIKNIFDPYNFNSGRHLIEIRLLLMSVHKYHQYFKINYLDSRLEKIYATGKLDKPDPDKELLSFDEHKLTLEILKNETAKDNKDILIKYSGSGGNWCNVRYYSTLYGAF